MIKCDSVMKCEEWEKWTEISEDPPERTMKIMIRSFKFCPWCGSKKGIEEKKEKKE